MNKNFMIDDDDLELVNGGMAYVEPLKPDETLYTSEMNRSATSAVQVGKGPSGQSLGLAKNSSKSKSKTKKGTVNLATTPVTAQMGLMSGDVSEKTTMC